MRGSASGVGGAENENEDEGQEVDEEVTESKSKRENDDVLKNYACNELKI